MKIAILGFGREGQATLAYLKSQKNLISKKDEVWILDLQRRTDLPGVDFKHIFGPNYLDNIDDFDIIYRTPGIPYHQLKKKVSPEKISSGTKLFFNNCPCPIIGVTGTKGKGTTSTLIYQILKNAGWDVYLAGNIGSPALTILPKLKKDSIVVLELSSFQLQDLNSSLHIAVVLDIFPDHQDAHSNLKEYFAAKATIAEHQKKADKIFYFADNYQSKKIGEASSAHKFPIDIKNFGLLSIDDLKIPGRHNLKNAVIAFSVAQVLGVPTELALCTIKEFRGLEHRLEFVRRWCGIDFYNDSASTNPPTTVAAIASFAEPKILIAGGKDKELDYKEWKKEFVKNKVFLAIVFGENKNKIKKALIESNLVIKTVANLKQAVFLAKKEALRRGVKLVIFSPGAASFDMFKDYADRGSRFKKLC